MTPRADEPQRRESRPQRRPSGIGAARAYTPRGRTVAERATETRQSSRPPVVEPRPAERPRVPRQRVMRRQVRYGAADVAPPPLANGVRRLRLSTMISILIFLIIVIRLVVLQLIESPGDEQALLKLRDSRLTTMILPATRGSILDRNGTILAQSIEGRYIFADPTQVKNPATEAAVLSPLLGVPVSTLVPLMTKHKRSDGVQSEFEYLARGVDIDTANKIMALNLAGIGDHLDEVRDVPGADAAANLIGFTGSDDTGLAGIEAEYNSLLSGTDGKNTYETGNPDTADGKLAQPIPGGYHRETAAKPGSSVELTIDENLQFEVQRSLAEHLQQVKAVSGAAVVLDTQTGEVLAQASYPTYNAAEPGNSTPAERADVATTDPYDPGSIHKAITLGAALQEGVITPQSAVTVGPALNIGGVLFPDDEPQKAGTQLTIPGILALSSDVGTIRIADKLGKDKLYAYQKKFGLGTATGEGLPGEASGALLAPDKWSGSAYGSVPIGYSVDATLIQMAAAYNAIANNGTYVQPHLIKATLDPNGKVTPTPAAATHQVLTPAVAAELRTLLEAPVYVKGATGTRAAVSNYLVAGKTGTASKLVDGQYSSNNSGSFIGMAPADHPRFVVAVYADVPSGSGGLVAAPAFSDMMSTALWQYKVPPTTAATPTFNIHP